MAGHAQPVALAQNDRVLLLAQLGLAMFLAGLDDVAGTWPHLHCHQGHWRSLFNFLAWRVLPAELLAGFGEDAKFHSAWTLLQWTDDWEPKQECLLPRSENQGLDALANDARRPRQPSRSERALLTAEQLHEQRQRDRAFWLHAADCFRSDNGRWVLFFRLNAGHLKRSAAAKLKLCEPLVPDAEWKARQ